MRRAFGILLGCVIFSALGFLVYLPAWRAYFVSDDFQLLKAIAAGGPFGVWTFHGGFFRPLVSLSLYLNMTLGGLNPVGYHAMNLLLHVANSLFVAMLAQLVIQSSAPRPAFADLAAWIAGAFFLLHPSHSESVAWVSGRTDLVAAFFALLTMLFYFLHREHGRRLLAAAMFFFLALTFASKEWAVVIPLILLGFEFSSGRPRLKLCAAFAASVPVYLLVRAWFVGALIGGYGAGRHLDFSVMKIGGAAASYVVRAFLPALSRDPISIAAWVVFGVLLMACVASAWKDSRQDGPGVGRFLAFAFVVSLAPAFNMGTSFFDSQGERLLYFPSAFASVLLAHVLTRRFSARIAAVFAVMILSVSGLAAHQAARNWRSAGALSETIAFGMFAPPAPGDVLLVNVPDNIRGAYVFRNGLQEAVDLTCGLDVPPRVRGGFWYAAPLEDVVVERSAREWTLRWQSAVPLVPTLSRASRQYVRADPSGADVVEVLATTPNSVTMWLSDPAAVHSCFIISSGGLSQAALPKTQGRGKR